MFFKGRSRQLPHLGQAATAMLRYPIFEKAPRLCCLPGRNPKNKVVVVDHILERKNLGFRDQHRYAPCRDGLEEAPTVQARDIR
jgi:hypothetical protein